MAVLSLILGKKVVCLNIADSYRFMEPALVQLLQRKVTPFLPSSV